MFLIIPLLILIVKEYTDLLRSDEFHKKASEDISFQMLSEILNHFLPYKPL